MPNKRGGVQIVGEEGSGKFSENLINRGGPNKLGGGNLGNLYSKIKYKIMFFMPVPKLIHSFSTSI